MPARDVLILPHDPAWRGRFAAEAARLLQLFAGVALDVHHVGSTAVDGLPAKPVLDVLLGVTSVEAMDARRADAEALGYHWHGEAGIGGRRYLTLLGPAYDAVHVHAFEAGHPEIGRHLAFRDYLRAHPERSAAYAALKATLAERHGADRAAYTDAKGAFIRETEALARSAGDAGAAGRGSGQ